jgi:16S rRNA (guanine527-N7)-methyltransferase
MVLTQLGAGWAPYVARVVQALSPATAPPAFEELGCRLLDLTVAWNSKMDLTAAKTPEELVDLTFADAVALFGRGELRASETWLDVGSGSGAPGLPLALLESHVDVTLLEPMQKRVAFLRTLIGSLGVRAQVLRGRVENARDQSTDVAISRATLPPAEWLREGTRVARRAVWVLLARDAAPSSAGWSVQADFSFDWPLTGRRRRLVAYERLAAGI